MLNRFSIKNKISYSLPHTGNTKLTKTDYFTLISIGKHVHRNNYNAV